MEFPPTDPPRLPSLKRRVDVRGEFLTLGGSKPLSIGGHLSFAFRYNCVHVALECSKIMSPKLFAGRGVRPAVSPVAGYALCFLECGRITWH
jgi:hypothetical protein